MAAFSELDWARFDVWSIVANSGIAVVDPTHRASCHQWLDRQGYQVRSIDFSRGIGPAVVSFGTLFKWEEQFGYTLTEDRCNLNALRDGFGYGLSEEPAHVLELLNPDVAYKEDPDWFQGLLAIGTEYSLQQLALGRRFFVVLVLAKETMIPGVAYETRTVPPRFGVGRSDDPFG